MAYKYPLAGSSWDDAEIEALKNVILSDQFTMGSKVKEFEDNFAQYFGTKYAVMVNSGSSANLLMVAALRLSDDPNLKLNAGDEIIVPAISWSTTYAPLQQYGLSLKFVDVDLFSLNYNLEMLESAISSKTKAIMAVNLLGNPNNFDRINELTENKGITLLEDNCESMGAKFKGQLTGTFGVSGSFSFFYSHHISTMEGGMVITNNDELFQLMLSLRSHGWTRNLPSRERDIWDNKRDPFARSFNFN